MSDPIPTRYCDLCGHEILAYHSWHADGHTLVHLMCELQRTPATGESFRWEGDANLMLEKRKHIAHTKDGRSANVPPHLRVKEAVDEDI